MVAAFCHTQACKVNEEPRTAPNGVVRCCEDVVASVILELLSNWDLAGMCWDRHSQETVWELLNEVQSGQDPFPWKQDVAFVCELRKAQVLKSFMLWWCNHGFLSVFLEASQNKATYIGNNFQPPGRSTAISSTFLCRSKSRFLIDHCTGEGRTESSPVIHVTFTWGHLSWLVFWSCLIIALDVKCEKHHRFWISKFWRLQISSLTSHISGSECQVHGT